MHGRVSSVESLTPSLVPVVLEGGDLAGLEMPGPSGGYRPDAASCDRSRALRKTRNIAATRRVRDPICSAFSREQHALP